MSRYKDYPIYGVEVPASDRQWYSRGLVFDRDLNQTIEIKRILNGSNPPGECLGLRSRPKNTVLHCAKTGLINRLNAQQP